mmetsp:Transcript_23285/g.70019  ORF Transcript_23285/g.70019 Transcript_23285/m.70019 type:complete len:279 (+) Transcript_23285:601-1437(+)
MTVSFLFNPWSAPYMRSFRRHDLCTVRSSWPVMVWIRASVCWARVNSDVYATSNCRPSFQIHVAPAAASFLPRMVSGTSAQPVKRFFSFQSLWPWRTKQILHDALSFQAAIVGAVDAARRRMALRSRGARGWTGESNAINTSFIIVAACERRNGNACALLRLIQRARGSQKMPQKQHQGVLARADPSRFQRLSLRLTHRGDRERWHPVVARAVGARELTARTRRCTRRCRCLRASRRAPWRPTRRRNQTDPRNVCRRRRSRGRACRRRRASGPGRSRR